MSGDEARVHDVVGIGAGPFNLSLAALADPVPDLEVVLLEARDDLSWHAGMMLPESTLQVPFLADLVTLVDPTSRWSFLSFLQQTDRLWPFYVRESFHPLRSEYDDYLRWVGSALGTVHTGQEVVRVRRRTDLPGEPVVHEVTTRAGRTWRARHLVVGVGSTPRLPRCVAEAGGPAVHTADYLAARERLRRCRTITVVGSGQSAAEVYHDLLLASPDHDHDLVWVTRSPRFFPMEYTKLTLEMTSPEYSAYFRSLPAHTRDRLLREQRGLYKGISAELVDAISDLHYRLRVQGHGPRTTLLTSTSLVGARWDGQHYDLDLHHDESQVPFGLRTDGLVLATGHEPTTPSFLDELRPRLEHDDAGRLLADASYAVDVTGREVFVQNAEEHTHGFVAPDLGMGAHRSATILNAVAGREVYRVGARVAVQDFGVPAHLLRQGVPA
ncbi:SidA/IucD/PvdA family monooxygenase [Nocardioides sp. 31GB23]|uniref:lysine N(6)-hydroxylase/L-ornithine N(5)-oxygenase family protein n=1 Tax=Nocardioides sp. 31GB23 TaxID=3156065 RepID=UPI0032AE8966